MRCWCGWLSITQSTASRWQRPTDQKEEKHSVPARWCFPSSSKSVGVCVSKSHSLAIAFPAHLPSDRVRRTQRHCCGTFWLREARLMPHTRTLLCEIPAEHLNPVAFSTATLISSTTTAPMASCRSGQLRLSKDSDASHSCKPRCRSSSTERKAKGSDVGVGEPSKGTGSIGKHQQTAAYI